ncbi:unnamed protein product [Clavelina lepadiformis]|uniref:Potassium channel domain-containing protein n=1 Tax=Clavelina lepadiformis TaxID=159417 RepID=A0ABP0FSS4_CLALP
MRWRILFGLVSFYVVYLLIGAGVFYALEYTHEENRCQEYLENLAQYNLTQARSTGNVSVEDLRNFIQLVLKAPQYGVQFDSTSTPSCAHNWYYQNAIFFAGTVITTIGYGNISPNTRGGQTFCIFFAIVGLPLFAVMFGAIGDKFAAFFKKLDRRMKSKGRNTKLRKTVVLLATTSFMIIFFLLVPSVIFVAVEEWTYHEAFYYSFISLTTIGFGDFVAGSNPDLTYPSIYRICVYFWILFGLAFMAAVISLFSDLIKGSANKASKKPSETKLDEEDVDEAPSNPGAGIDNVSLKVPNGAKPFIKVVDDKVTSDGDSEIKVSNEDAKTHATPTTIS